MATLELQYNLVQCLLHHAYLISSDWNIFSKEFDFLKSVFAKNGYPSDFFFACVNKFLNSKCGTFIHSLQYNHCQT